MINTMTRILAVIIMITLSTSAALAEGLIEIARMTVADNRVKDVKIVVGGALGGTFSINGVRQTIESINKIRTFMVDVSSDKTIIIESESASNLIHMDCNNSSLTSLDVSDCDALMYLYCNNNLLTALDMYVRMHCLDRATLL